MAQSPPPGLEGSSLSPQHGMDRRPGGDGISVALFRTESGSGREGIETAPGWKWGVRYPYGCWLGLGLKTAGTLGDRPSITA